MPSLAAWSLIISFVGWFSYIPVAKIPKLRRTLWPTRLLFYLSLIPAIIAIALQTDDAKITLMFVSCTCISFALFTLSFYAAIKLPVAAGRPEIDKLLPDFEVIGEDGKPFSPNKFSGKGPLLLVFFRGFW